MGMRYSRRVRILQNVTEKMNERDTDGRKAKNEVDVVQWGRKDDGQIETEKGK